ncbi:MULTISPECIES: hypothetical protein [Acinetobacter]|uniref:hypothetical protein n=1 Tax=Acinetobacter TaxID=469 RepID=UPI0021CD4DB0|nr:hypothetical protein [Acinetobacter haemolyticus]MCU4379312.1 hypothetical protein [Acinetobacter haemolyticus]
MNLLLNKAELTSEKLSDVILSSFEKYGHVTLLCDETLLNGFFDEFTQNLTDFEKEPIELAASSRNKKADLFFIKIKKKEDLENTLNFLTDTLLLNLDQQEDGYFICGFGYVDDLKVTVENYKKFLIAKDAKNKFIFRWYDARVLVYLPTIIHQKSEQIESILQHWNFVFFNGLYEVRMEERLQVFPFNFNEIESQRLDLIELSNTVIKQSLKYDSELEINHNLILESLDKAIKQYGILFVTDLIAYGMYSVILHHDFMHSPTVNKVLTQYWTDRVREESFTDAMSYLEEHQYLQVKQESEGVYHV